MHPVRQARKAKSDRINRGKESRRLKALIRRFPPSIDWAFDEKFWVRSESEREGAGMLAQSGMRSTS
jgi:hypothetical protein